MGRGKEGEQAAVYDGMEALATEATRLRFGQDLRLLEVRALPPLLPIPQPSFVQHLITASVKHTGQYVGKSLFNSADV